MANATEDPKCDTPVELPQPEKRSFRPPSRSNVGPVSSLHLDSHHHQEIRRDGGSGDESEEERGGRSMISDLVRRSTDDSRLFQTALARAIDSFRSTMADNEEGGARRAKSLPIGALYSSGYVEANKVSEEVANNSKRLHKRIIICCDGTWKNALNEDDPRQATNVLRLARSIFPEDRRTFPPVPQIVHYQTGLGTSGDPALDAAAGATGVGISAKIREAYAFIAQNYIPGDEVFLFGFSRGAFTARTIASLIADIGILSNDGMENFYKIFAAYQARGNCGNAAGDGDKLERFLDKYRAGGEKNLRGMPAGTLKCVGVWDTVGALGIPGLFKQSPSQRLLGFVDNNLSPHVQYAFHAMAIHETREDFVPTKWIQTHEGSTYLESHAQKKQVLKQVWFAGAHSDVGGGTLQHDLADISLVWMVANLMKYELLSIDREYLEAVLSPNSEWGEMSPVDSRTGLMMLRPETTRKLPGAWNPSTREKIHPSVEHQHVVCKELKEILGNPTQREILVDKLLPFEIEMRDSWDSLKGRIKQEVMRGSSVENRWGLGRGLVELLGDFFHLGLDRLTVHTSGEDSEEMALKALGASGPSMSMH